MSLRTTVSSVAECPVYPARVAAGVTLDAPSFPGPTSYEPSEAGVRKGQGSRLFIAPSSRAPVPCVERVVMCLGSCQCVRLLKEGLPDDQRNTVKVKVRRSQLRPDPGLFIILTVYSSHIGRSDNYSMVCINGDSWSLYLWRVEGTLPALAVTLFNSFRHQAIVF